MLTGRRDIARPAMKRGEHPTAERAAPRFTDWPNVARTGGACRFRHSVLVPALCADMARFPRFPRVFSWGNRCKARGCWWFPRFPRFHHQTSGTTANTAARAWLMAEPERVARDLHFREFSGNRGNCSRWLTKAGLDHIGGGWRRYIPRPVSHQGPALLDKVRPGISGLGLAALIMG